MPSLQAFDVLFDLTNDLHNPISIQLLRDYGRTSARTIVLHPTESLTLILESGISYQYAVKSQTKVANVTWVTSVAQSYFALLLMILSSAKSWSDITCSISQLFGAISTDPLSSQTQGGNGIRVDRIWKDQRFNVWNDL